MSTQDSEKVIEKMPSKLPNKKQYFINLALGLGLLFILGLFFGSSSNIDMVKNGYMDFDKSTTVGKALDNWNYCKNGVWDEFETDNGTQVVEFSCDVTGIDKKMENIKKLYSKDEPYDSKKHNYYLDIDNIKYTFQFAINHDDTFEINYAGSSITWKDGTSFSDSVNEIEVLNNAYNDKNIFALSNNESENHRIAYAFMYTLSKAKSMAK